MFSYALYKLQLVSRRGIALGTRFGGDQ
ncbi:protein of unknown function [Acidithiobacillus ferrivorans]|uniref:Uncharacterized protein n=1 Tax=Acidithiobacillus ferrivorans TaxID=160808 RepID=A0A060UR78_9PROT|nr:hypothetical protein AFERRI_150044 [Acidithiobacillus ferrivorans]SMH65629.1 protein of unknown function [Acidithiobacillus ferrivorans]